MDIRDKYGASLHEYERQDNKQELAKRIIYSK